MGKYQKFDEVPVWQEAARLYGRVLDMMDEPNPPLSATFRNQLERAALAVSNAVALAMDGAKSAEMISLLTIARRAAAEVESMSALMIERPKTARLQERLQEIRGLAEVCGRQLGAWKHAMENPERARPESGEEKRQQAGNPQRPTTPRRSPGAIGNG